MNNFNNARRENDRRADGNGGWGGWGGWGGSVAFVLLAPAAAWAIHRWMESREEMLKHHSMGYREALAVESKRQENELSLYKSKLQAKERSLKELDKKMKASQDTIALQRKKLEGESHAMALQRKKLQDDKCEFESKNGRLQVEWRTMVSQREELKGKQNALESQHAQLKEERRKLDSLRHVGPLHNEVVSQEDRALDGVRSSLKVLEHNLEHRQAIYCSTQMPQHGRLDLERNMLQHADSHPLLSRMAVRDGLREIFDHDGHCSNTGQRNGKLMWVYMRHWESLMELHKYQRAQQRMQTEDPLNPHSA